MKFYRVHYRMEGGNSAGFSWHTSKREAKKQAAEAVRNDPDEYDAISGPPTLDEVEIKPTRAGILAALRSHAAHGSNDP